MCSQMSISAALSSTFIDNMADFDNLELNPENVWEADAYVLNIGMSGAYLIHLRCSGSEGGSDGQSNASVITAEEDEENPWVEE